MMNILISLMLRAVRAAGVGMLSLAKLIARHFVERAAVFAAITILAAFLTAVSPEASWAETAKVVYSELVIAIKKAMATYSM